MNSPNMRTEQIGKINGQPEQFDWVEIFKSGDQIIARCFDFAPAVGLEFKKVFTFPTFTAAETYFTETEHYFNHNGDAYINNIPIPCQIWHSPRIKLVRHD